MSDLIKKIAGPFILCFSMLNCHAALTWHWQSVPADAGIKAYLESSMNAAVATWNTYADYSGDIPVIYNSGVPTAQTDGMGGLIEFGASQNYRTAVHETCHWLGTGTAGNWTAFNGSPWGGTYGNSAIQSFDGPTATIGSDSLHFWPYNWNYDSEQAYPERVVSMVGALRRDMGLTDMTLGYAPGTYRLRNRQNVKLLDCEGSASDGAQVKQYAESGSANQQWVLSLVSGTAYFTFRSVGNGKLLDSLGMTNQGAPIVLLAENFSPSQQWRIVQTDSGFYQFVNRATGKCLSAATNSTDGTGLVGITPGSGLEQQWKFLHPTLLSKAAGLISQYRPTTAGSYGAGHLPNDATDGNTGATRWGAIGGAFPQQWRVDLGAPFNLSNAVTYWFPGYSFQYRIETSTNDVNYTTAMDATANTVVGTTTNNFSATARYVRITTTGINPGGWAAFYDCQIFGTPTIPAAPSGLSATQISSSRVNLSWADIDGISAFNLWRATNNGGPYASIALNVKGVGYSDSGLDPSTTYYYVATATNSSGESGNSAQANATTPAASAPFPPTTLTAMPGNTQVVLNWSDSPEATSYNIKRGTTSGGPYTNLTVLKTNTYTDTSLVNGRAYYYVVSGTNAAGESADSSEVMATPSLIFAHWKFNETSGTTALDSIAGRNGTLVGGGGWAPGKVNNAVSLNGASGYVSLPAGVVSSLSGNFSIATWVYVNANSSWARLFDFGTGTTAYMFLAPQSGGNTLRYAITTSGGGGEQQINGPVLSPGSWHHVAVTLFGVTGTLYVDGLPAGTNSSLTLKPANLGSTTLNYIGKSQYSDPCFNGRVDDFRIYNRTLTSAEIVAMANIDGLPSAPANVYATAGLNQVALNWTGVASAPLYKVKRSLTSGGPYTTIGTSTTVNYTDTTAVNGITYYYVIAAVNGAGQSTNSVPLAATPTDLLAYYKFDETSGANAADSSGSNSGTLVGGASWAQGEINNATSLNGSSSYINLPPNLVTALKDFSVASWVYVNATTARARLFDFGAGTGAYMCLTPTSNGSTVRYAITTSGAYAEQQINSTSALPAGAWHHVAVTLSGTNGTLYVDGVSVGTNTSMTLNPSSLGNVAINYIGRSQTYDSYLNGKVDDFRIYRRALSAAEVSTLFTSNGTVPSAPSGLGAIPGTSQVSLSWSGVAGATSYKVKRGTTNGGPYVTITNFGGTAFMDGNLLNGTPYFYVLTAANISGESTNSAQVSAIPSATSATNILMSVASGALTLSWPVDHTGWRLQVQTNGLASTNWVDVPGSGQTNNVAMPVDATTGSAFYRLVYP